MSLEDAFDHLSAKSEYVLIYSELLTFYNPTYVTGEVRSLVGCFGFNGPFRQYYSLYQAVSQRGGERKEKR